MFDGIGIRVDKIGCKICNVIFNLFVFCLVVGVGLWSVIVFVFGGFLLILIFCEIVL